MELIPVNIILGDRTYRLKIEPEDEEGVRKAVKMINEKIIEFRGTFAGKDMQDFIAMVLIWFATEKIKAAPEMFQLEGAIEKLKQLETSIDRALETV